MSYDRGGQGDHIRSRPVFVEPKQVSGISGITSVITDFTGLVTGVVTDFTAKARAVTAGTRPTRTPSWNASLKARLRSRES